MKAKEILLNKINSFETRFDAYRNGELIDNPINISLSMKLMDNNVKIFVDGYFYKKIEDINSKEFSDEISLLENLTLSAKNELIKTLNYGE